jgi:transcriptional regulator with XRE-family HTH domain
LCCLLTEARKRAGLTQQDLADKIGKPQSFVAKVEGGERRLDIVELIEISGYIKLNMKDLVKSISER